MIPPVELTASTTILSFFDFIFSTLTKFKFKTESMCCFMDCFSLVKVPKSFTCENEKFLFCE